MIDEARLTVHRDGSPTATGRYVLYWMQASVRTRDNHALEYAVQIANEAGRPLVVGFGLDPDYADASPRTLQFLVEGLVDVAGGLTRRNIGFVVRTGQPLDVARALAADAAAVVMDRNYLREPRAWRSQLARTIGVPVTEVESNVVVPLEAASDKREWAARTIRPKLHDRLDRFTKELATTAIDRHDPPDADSLDASDRAALLEAIGIEDNTAARFSGGEHQAHAALRRFIDEGLSEYDRAGTAVTGDLSSHMSMYLHFGHISPAAITRAVQASGLPKEPRAAYLEEIVVRRELAHNYVWYEPDYDTFGALPDWARTTLEQHRNDVREHVYTAAQLEGAETHDPYWNAAMVELRETGYLHNRMRMYWGKRILDWTNTPEYAYRVALDLNNRHFLDGRDPNSYANVGWLFGLHDQAFAERPVIGKVRPMTRSGLQRKIEAEAYVRHVEELSGETISRTD
jgi:deoxyribodipyrimidine photo-lyase